VAAIFGQPDFGTLTFTINNSHFYYGDLLDAAITFISVAAAIYFFVVLPLNKIAERRARGQAPAAEELPPDIDLLTQIRDLLAGKDGTPKSE
jgi:large conductance mechanosensitive channel